LLTVSISIKLYLILPTEDMSIVLLEPSDTGEAGQGSGQLVSVQDSEIRHSQGQLLPGPDHKTSLMLS
jgi:hypothetical protein